MTSAWVGRQGDEAELYTRYAPKLRRIVAHQVRTSSANVEDACSHAWLQMLRYQPARETLLSWLVRTGTREAVKLDRRARRDDELLDATDERHTVTLSIAARLDVLAAFEAIVDARLRAREAAHAAHGRAAVITRNASCETRAGVSSPTPRPPQGRAIVGWRAERAVARTCWRRLRPRLQGGRQRPVRRAAPRRSGARRAQLRGDVGDLKCASPGRIRISGLANGLCHERVLATPLPGRNV